MYSKKIIAGLSLIELMIALMLSIMILISVYSILLYSLKVLYMQTGAAHLQENYRAITQLLTQEFSHHKISIYYSDEIKPDTDACTAKNSEKETNYFIAQTDRFNKDRSPVFSLFKKEKDHHKEELIDNVYQMEINYDVLEENKVFEIKPSKVTDWDHVVGVSIAYELRDSDSMPAQRKKGFAYVAL